MRRAYFTIIPLAGALLAAILIVWEVTSRSGIGLSVDARALPFQLEDVTSAHITPRSPFFIADVDADGEDDLLISEPDRLLWFRLRGSTMILAGEATYEWRGSTGTVADVNGDGHPEFFVLMESPEGAIVACHDWFSPKGPSVPLYTVGPLHPRGGSGSLSAQRVFLLGSCAAEKGASPAIFIGLNPIGREGTGRSLIAIDGATGRDLWRFDFAPHTVEVVSGAFGPNDTRVLLTTAAVGKKLQCDGTTDDVSYIFCLDRRDGRLLWRKEMTGLGGRSMSALADINGDDRSEIIVARHIARSDPLLLSEPPPWTVAVLSGEGELLRSSPLGHGATSICAADLDGDRSLEVVVQGLDDWLTVLNSDLSIRRTVKPIQSETRLRALVYGARDVTGDAELEIASRLDSFLVVRNHRGIPIAVRTCPLMHDAQFARYDGKDHIVVSSVDSIRVMLLDQTPLATRFAAYSRRLAIPVLAAATIAGVGGFHLRRYVKRRRERHITFDEARDDLLTAMAAFGHGGSSLKIIDRIRLHLKNWDRAQADSAARDALFSRLRATFMETVVPELQHIVMLAHKAHVPDEIWSSIAARAVRAGQAMEAIRAACSTGSAAPREHFEEALVCLGEVDERLAGIRAYLRTVFRTPLAEAMERVAARFLDEHGGEGISLAPPPDIPADVGLFISPVAFGKVLEALLSNSARAVEGRAGAAVAIEIRWEGDYCKIDVRDNGCGIPREDWMQVFERSYTTKEEGGFGLHYSREELARFGGKINVVASAPGEGTTMRVILRKS